MANVVKNIWQNHRWARLTATTALVTLAIALALVGGIYTWLEWEWLRASEDGKASNGDTLRNVGFIVAGVVALLFAFWRARVAGRQANAAQEQTATAQQSLLNERYQRGAEMLGSPVPSVRLGGIFALRRLAEECPEQYNIQIMRLFCAFVRDPDGDGASRLTDRLNPALIAPHSLRQDVQAAVEGISSILAGGTYIEREPDAYVDLRGSRLSGIRLEGGDLSRVDLSYAELVRADLENTKLRGVKLQRTQLQNSNLRNTDLTGAVMFRTDLVEANLRDATLDGALILEVNLERASFHGSSLRRTVFTDTQISESQRNQAQVDPHNPPRFLSSAAETEPDTENHSS